MSDQPHKMQSLAEFMASPDALTPAGAARRYADAAAAGVEIGTVDNPFPGLSPEEIADMDAFKANLLRELSLGRPYGSEHMNLQPGSKVAVEIDGVLYSDTVTCVRRESATPEVMRRLSRWRRIIRKMTPKRFRKSLVIRAAQPAGTVITTGASR